MTTSIGRGFSRCTQKRTTPFPEIKKPDWKVMDQKIASMLVWLESHIDRFSMPVSCKTRNEFTDHLKPLVECSLLLYVLTGDRHRQHGSPYVRWAERIAKRLFWHIEQEALIESFRLYPTTSLAMLVYPFLERAAGKLSPFHDEVIRLLEVPEASSHERTPMRKMDFHFLCRMMEANPTPDPPMDQQLTDTLLFNSPNPLLLSNDDVYDVTHAFFYATQFGEKDCKQFHTVNDWLKNTLPSLTLALSLDKDNDIAGELLLSGVYSNQPLGNCQSLALNILLEGIEESGAVPGPDRSMGEVKDEFLRCYHTTLVAVLALLETRIEYGQPWSEQQTIPEKPDRENQFLIEAAEKLVEHFDIEAEYGQNKVRKKEKDLCFLVSKEKQTFVVSRYNHNSKALQDSFQCQMHLADYQLAPSLMHYSTENSSESVWSIREYLSGESWLNKFQTSLPAGYFQLGLLSARIHRVQPVQLTDSLNQHWIITLNKALSTNPQLASLIQLFNNHMKDCQTALLHGDLHLGNIIETEIGPKCIDFDESGIGAPEMDLAIALAYVNTDLEEFSACREQLLKGYVLKGGSINKPFLNVCTVLAPLYVSEKQINIFCGIEYQQTVENIRRIALRQTETYLNLFKDTLHF